LHRQPRPGVTTESGGNEAHQQESRAAPHSNAAPQPGQHAAAGGASGVFIAREPLQCGAQELHLTRKFSAMHANREVRMYDDALDEPDPAVHRFRNQPVYLFTSAHSRILRLGPGVQAALP
jgi:hypothetical protein